MSDRPLVSVIVPTRNRRHLLAEALASVERQTYAAWEAIVVDDASQDDTWEWLETLPADRFRRLRLERHAGSTVTRNAGLRAARGDLCLFLDDDDRLPPPALAHHLAALERWPTAVATLGAVARIDAAGAAAPGLLRPSPLPRLRRRIWRDVMFWWVYVVGASLFRRATLESIGGFDEAIVFFGDDVDLWLRLGHQGDVALLPDTVLEYRSHGQTRPDDYLEMLTALRRRHAETAGGARHHGAHRLLAAHDALADLRLRAGERGGLLRIGTLLARLATCPDLAVSPLARREIGAAIRRDLAMSPWRSRGRR